METFYGLCGVAICIFAGAFLLNGFPTITINKHYYYKTDKKTKNNE